MAFALLFLACAGARAEGSINLELNKMEPVGKGCRIYMVFSNETADAIDSFKPDLVFFGQDGVIADRLVVEGGPLPAGKTRVKLFDVGQIDCGSLERVLLNDIRACAGQLPAACLAITNTSSRSGVGFIK